MTLDDFYAQMMANGGTMPQSPYLPPQQSDALGLPYPTSLMGNEMMTPPGGMPDSAMVDPMLGLTSDFGSAPTATDQYGYSTQPRTILPPQITEGPDSLYGPFRRVWEGLQQEQDPLAALMAQSAIPPEEPPPTQWPQLGMIQSTPAYGGGADVLRNRGFGPAVDRIQWLDTLRARRGY